MKNLKEFVKIEEHARVVSAWKYLPFWQRKLLRLKFQIEVARNTINIPRLINRALLTGTLGTPALAIILITPHTPQTFSGALTIIYLASIAAFAFIKPKQTIKQEG